MKNKIEGLGDVVALFTKFTRLDRLTKWIFGIFGKDCGCTRRQKKLNRLIPFKMGE